MAGRPRDPAGHVRPQRAADPPYRAEYLGQMADPEITGSQAEPPHRQDGYNDHQFGPAETTGEEAAGQRQHQCVRSDLMADSRCQADQEKQPEDADGQRPVPGGNGVVTGHAPESEASPDLGDTRPESGAVPSRLRQTFGFPCGKYRGHHDEKKEEIQRLWGEVVLVGPVRDIEEGDAQPSGAPADPTGLGDNQERRQIEQLEHQRGPAQEVEGVRLPCEPDQYGTQRETSRPREPGVIAIEYVPMDAYVLNEAGVYPRVHETCGRFHGRSGSEEHDH